MAVRVALTHRTTYEYERPAQMGPQIVRLRPAPHNRTPIHSYSLKIQPPEHFLNWQQDPHGNFLARIVVPEKTKRFEVIVDMVADLEAYNPFDFFLEPGAENYPFEYSPEQRHELTTCLEKSELTPELAAFLEGVDRTSRRTVDFLVDLNQKISDAVDYVIRMEPGVQTPEETLGVGSGSCRDSAWLLVQAARQLGIAARFVSGYLIQLTPASTGGATWTRSRFHRLACVGRGLCSRRRLDRTGPHERSLRGRRSYSGSVCPDAHDCSAGRGRSRKGRRFF